MPEVIDSPTVVSPESCRVAMYVKCSEDSERISENRHFKLPHSDAPSPANPRE